MLVVPLYLVVFGFSVPSKLTIHVIGYVSSSLFLESGYSTFKRGGADYRGLWSNCLVSGSYNSKSSSTNGLVGRCFYGSAIFSCPTVHGIELLFLAEHPLVSIYHFRHSKCKIQPCALLRALVEFGKLIQDLSLQRTFW